MDTTVDVFPVETERLSAAAFLKLVRDNPSIIKSSSVVNPMPGRPGFGAFQVVYSRPIYKSLIAPKLARTR